ncbi:unnamed protein product [Pedinophyceae sp. YPF-701]|nr:unnamed protein product [Pedinophyceae sp. YPF-701]
MVRGVKARTQGLTPSDYLAAVKDLDSALVGLVGYLEAAERITGPSDGRLTSQEFVSAFEVVGGSIAALLDDAKIVQDALSRSAAGQDFYTKMHVGTVDRVREGWREKWAGTTDVAPSRESVFAEDFLDSLPQRCVTEHAFLHSLVRLALILAVACVASSFLVLGPFMARSMSTLHED